MIRTLVRYIYRLGIFLFSYIYSFCIPGLKVCWSSRLAFTSFLGLFFSKNTVFISKNSIIENSKFSLFCDVKNKGNECTDGNQLIIGQNAFISRCTFIFNGIGNRLVIGDNVQLRIVPLRS